MSTPSFQFVELMALLEFSFSSLVIREPTVSRMLRKSFSDIQEVIVQISNEILHDNECNWETFHRWRSRLQMSLNLEIIPFCTAIESNWPVRDVDEDDERRLVFQAMLLYILRQYIPLKYANVAQFLDTYPAISNRDQVEVSNLMKVANWFDLLFFTVGHKTNKNWAMNLVIRLSEGRAMVASYITGRWETAATSNRVYLFQNEGFAGNSRRISREGDQVEAVSTNEDSVAQIPSNNAASSLGDSLNDIVKRDYHGVINNHMSSEVDSIDGTVDDLANTNLSPDKEYLYSSTNHAEVVNLKSADPVPVVQNDANDVESI